MDSACTKAPPVARATLYRAWVQPLVGTAPTLNLQHFVIVTFTLLTGHGALPALDLRSKVVYLRPTRWYQRFATTQLSTPPTTRATRSTTRRAMSGSGEQRGGALRFQAPPPAFLRPKDQAMWAWYNNYYRRRPPTTLPRATSTRKNFFKLPTTTTTKRVAATSPSRAISGFEVLPETSTLTVGTTLSAQNASTNLYYICTVVRYTRDLWKSPRDCIDWLSNWERQRNDLVLHAESVHEDCFHENVALVVAYLFPTSYFRERPTDSFHHVVLRERLPSFEFSMLLPSDTLFTVTSSAATEIGFHVAWLNDLMNLPYFRQWLSLYDEVRRIVLELYRTHARDQFRTVPGEVVDDCLWSPIVTATTLTTTMRELPLLPLYPLSLERQVLHTYTYDHYYTTNTSSVVRKLAAREEFKTLQRQFGMIAQTVYQQPFLATQAPLLRLMYQTYYGLDNGLERWQQLLQICEHLIHPTPDGSLSNEWLRMPLSPRETDKDVWSITLAVSSLYGDVSMLDKQPCRKLYAVNQRRALQRKQTWPNVVPPIAFGMTKADTTLAGAVYQLLSTGTIAPAEALKPAQDVMYPLVVKRVSRPAVSALTNAATAEMQPIDEAFFQTLEGRMQTQHPAVFELWTRLARERSLFRATSATPLATIYERRAELQLRDAAWLDAAMHQLYSLFVFSHPTTSTMVEKLERLVKDPGSAKWKLIFGDQPERKASQYNLVLTLLETICLRSLYYKDWFRAQKKLNAWTYQKAAAASSFASAASSSSAAAAAPSDASATNSSSSPPSSAEAVPAETEAPP